MIIKDIIKTFNRPFDLLPKWHYFVNLADLLRIVERKYVYNPKLSSDLISKNNIVSISEQILSVAELYNVTNVMKSVSIPDFQLSETSEMVGSSNWTSPDMLNIGTIDFIFNTDNFITAQSVYHKWLRFMFDPVTNTQYARNVYERDITVYILDRSSVIQKTIVFKKCSPRTFTDKFTFDNEENGYQEPIELSLACNGGVSFT